MSEAIDPALALLTSEQLAAITTPLQRVFFEAEPGSGKTTVAAQRFGSLRFRTTSSTVERDDHRAVAALSFTRSATRELRDRVRQSWGSSALHWPHRIVTIDSLLYELLSHLLTTGELRWPSGDTTLEVKDSWQALGATRWNKRVASVELHDRDVVVGVSWAMASAVRPDPAAFRTWIMNGVCTHDEVRRVLELALADREIRASLTDRIRSTFRAVIIDEVFDANRLDLKIVILMMQSDIAVTLIGDPWQALYGFRGAMPGLVPEVVEQTGTSRLPLTTSFRWRTFEQKSLANALRTGASVVLPDSNVAEVDVVLACVWKELWEADGRVLPLAFGAAKGNDAEAASTLLLNEFTRAVLGEDATYLADALTTLAITDAEALRRLETPLQYVLEILRLPGTNALRNAYVALVDAVSSESSNAFPAVHGAYTKRLGALRDRLLRTDRLVAGMTVHQAKGREWDVVGIRLAAADSAALAGGLVPDKESHRQLYVACTRARYWTFQV